MTATELKILKFLIDKGANFEIKAVKPLYIWVQSRWDLYDLVTLCDTVPNWNDALPRMDFDTKDKTYSKSGRIVFYNVPIELSTFPSFYTSVE